MTRIQTTHVTHEDPRDKRQPSRNSNDRRQIIVGPTHEEIAVRAYQIFEERGRAPGRDVEDWAQAEQELRWDQ